jgi:hypothetical protein
MKIGLIPVNVPLLALGKNPLEGLAKFGDEIIARLG